MGIRCPENFRVVQCSSLLVHCGVHKQRYSLRPKGNKSDLNANVRRTQRRKGPRILATFKKPTARSEQASIYAQYLCSNVNYSELHHQIFKDLARKNKLYSQM